MQTTVARELGFSGVGLHGGCPVRMTVRPAAAGHGIRFRRIDLQDGGNIIPACPDAVAETRLRTVLCNDAGVRVSTVEHAMAAFAACGLDNALVDIDGPELPILDGSGLLFAEGLESVGLRSVGGKRRALRVLRRVAVEQDGAMVVLEPVQGDLFEIDFSIEFADSAIGRQRLELALSGREAISELLPARTFVSSADVERVRQQGLGRGGSLANTVVVEGDRVLNEEGLRAPDEFVRHKMMDVLGDLYLCGCPIIGRFIGRSSGHGLTVRLLQKLLADFGAWRGEPAPASAGIPQLLSARKEAGEALPVAG